MSDTRRLSADLATAQQAVHEVCDFIHAAPFLPNTISRCRHTRRSPLELAAQVYLTTCLRRYMPNDTFISDFRGETRMILESRDLDEIIRLLGFAGRGIPFALKDLSALNYDAVRALLSGRGSIQKGGEIQNTPSKIPHALNPSAPAFNAGTTPDSKPNDIKPPATPPSTTLPVLTTPTEPRALRDKPDKSAQKPLRSHDVNRVWVLQPLDNLEAALSGRPFCISATLFRNGAEAVTAIGVPNYALTSQYYRIELPGAYGAMFGAVRERGASVVPIAPRRRGVEVSLRLQPRDPAWSRLPGHKGFPLINIIVPQCQRPEAKGHLMPLQNMPARHVPPTGPRVTRLGGNANRIASLQTKNTRIAKTEMMGTGPTIDSVFQSHAQSVFSSPSTLLCHINVAIGRVHASVHVPRSTISHHDAMIWHEAGGSLLVREAGGIVTDAEGEALNFSTGRSLKENFGILATCPGMTHWRLLDAIKGDLVVLPSKEPSRIPGSDTGRWTTRRNFGPWETHMGKKGLMVRDPEYGPMTPKMRDTTPMKLRTHTYRRFDAWPRARSTWQQEAANGSRSMQGGIAKKVPLPGRTSSIIHLPEEAKTVPHSGPCAWPCEFCEPEDHKDWNASSLQKKK